MKKLLFVLLTMIAFNSIQITRAEEVQLPEIAPVDETPLPPLEEAK